MLTPNRSMGRRARGVTLIELLIAFVILGLLVKLALPSFVTWISNAQVRSVAESLQQGMRTAQGEALRLNRQVVLSFTNQRPDLNAVATAGGFNWSIQTVAQFGAADARFVQGGALGDVTSGVTIASTGAPITALCFNSMGRLVVNTSPGPTNGACAATNAAFIIDRPNSDRPLQVLVGVAGHVRMCDPNRPVLSAAAPDGCPP